MNTINKEKLLNKRYEKHLNLELRKLASQNVQRDYYIKEQEPGLIDLYSKDGFEVGELIELGFKSIEDAARYIDILSGYKNPKLFPEQPTGRTNREKFIGTCIMLDASAQECLKDLIDANYRIWPDSFHSFIIAEDRDVVDKLIKKYHLTEMRRGVDIFNTHNVYNGDIVDYVSQSTIDRDEYLGASINRTFKDIMKDARKTRHDEYAYLSQKYDFDEDLENSIYDKMNKIDDEESLNEEVLLEKTSFEQEIGRHLFADINNRETNAKGLHQEIINKYSDELYQLCIQLTGDDRKGRSLFEEIKSSKWETHHINGLHQDDRINPNNLALVRKSIHESLTKENYEFIGNLALEKLPLMHHPDVDKLILRLFAIMIANKINYESVFNFKVEGFHDFLLERLPQQVASNFKEKYPISSTDVILIKDLHNLKLQSESKNRDRELVNV